MYIPRKYSAVNRRRCVVSCAEFQSAVRSVETAVTTVGSFLSHSLVGIVVSHCKDEELYLTTKPPKRSYFDLHFLQNQIEQRERERENWEVGTRQNCEPFYWFGRNCCMEH
jgi:hypothetical protein